MGTDLVMLGGGPEERGQALGKVRGDQIGRWLENWLESLAHAGISHPRSYVARLLRDTDYLAAVERHTPDILTELRAVARGADLPFDLLFAAQLMDEEWVYRKAHHGSAPGDKCSSFAIRSSDGMTWIGQNMDLDRFTHGHQLLLRTEPNGQEPGTFVFTVGGLIALLGVNACRIAVCVNYLPQLPTSTAGLPIAFVIRRVLQSRSLVEAISFVRNVPHAVGQHYLLADADEIHSLEASAAGVFDYEPADRSRIFHTNHPLTSASEDLAVPGNRENSEARLAALARRLGQGEVKLGSLQASLSSSDDPDHPICRTAPDDPSCLTTNVIGFTTGSMITALDRRRGDVETWLSKGPPSLSGYERFVLLAEGA